MALCEFGKNHRVDVSSSNWRIEYSDTPCNCQTEGVLILAWDSAIKFDSKYNERVAVGQCGLCGIKHRISLACKVRTQWSYWTRNGGPQLWDFPPPVRQSEHMRQVHERNNAAGLASLRRRG